MDKPNLSQVNDEDNDNLNSTKGNSETLDKLSTKGVFEGLGPEEVKAVKKRLLLVGNAFQRKVTELIRNYNNEDIAFETIEECSKTINKSEAKFGLYLSFLKKTERLYGRYAKTRHIKELYIQRLSEASTVWLQRFEPHIVGITSYNRAKQLAEALTGLYQKERLELYQSARGKHLASVTDRVLMESIRDCLQYCFIRCQEFAWKQNLWILEHLTLSSKYNIDNCPTVIRLRIREVQKRAVSYTLPFIQKTIRQSVISELRLRPIVKFHHTQKPPLRSFLDLCAEVTWFMQFQDPPIVLDFLKEDRTRFMPFAYNGSVMDFVIWPAMLLQENGMIVSLGVAEFRDDVSSNTQMVMT